MSELGKSANLGEHSQSELDALAHRLNDRPRKVLGSRTPAETFQAHIEAARALLLTSGASRFAAG